MTNTISNEVVVEKIDPTQISESTLGVKSEIKAKFLEVLISDIKVSNRKQQTSIEEVQTLVDSISTIGLINPVTLTPSFNVIAGLKRIKAFEVLGYTTIHAQIIDYDEIKAELAEIDENFIRTNLTDLEKLEKLARRKEIYELMNIKPKTNKCLNKNNEKNSLENKVLPFTKDTANKVGLSQRSIQLDLKIVNNLAIEVRDIIRNTPIANNKSELKTLSEQNPDLQKKLALIVLEEKVKNIRKAINKVNFENLISPPLPQDDYDLILADPAWDFDDAKDHYVTMSTSDIKAMNIPSAENCILFMWAISSMLPEALEVMESWGFKYKSSAIWDKDSIGLGSWFRLQHEILLVGIKGDFKTPEPSNRVSSVHREERRSHSQKPDYYYEIIEKMYPNTKKIELFARNNRNGWTSWGNQVPSEAA